MAQSCLPTKKRKESRDFTNPAITTTTYCLPVKKRVWAIQPFDLNLEYQPTSNDLNQGNSPPVPISKVQESEPQIKEEQPENRQTEIIREDEDDGILCSICQSTDGNPSDPIVFCDGCDIMVHATCYGYPLNDGIPDGDWFCAKCLASKSQILIENHKIETFSCCLCPVNGGALKPTIDGKWAHVVCALFVPEVYFEDPQGREGINIGMVPSRRWKQRCYVCKSKKGCVIDCSEPKCPLAFHVTCGLKEDLCIEYSEGRNNAGIVAGFCRTHTDLWSKQQETGKFKIVPRRNMSDK